MAIETWMVDHAGRPNDEASLAGIARDLAFLDPQGGRPAGAAGPPRPATSASTSRPAACAPPRRAGVPRALPPATPPERLGAGDTTA